MGKILKISLIFFFIYISIVSYSQSIELSQPLNRAVLENLKAHFEWQKNNATKYYLSISKDSAFSEIKYYIETTENYVDTVFDDYDKYFWKVEDDLGNLSQIYSQQLFKVSLLSNLELWFRADSLIDKENNLVTEWGDLSSNSNSATQTGDYRPFYIDSIPELNNLSAIKFDGENDFMEFNEINTIRTIFIVFNHETGTSSAYTPILGHSSLYNFHGSNNDKLFNSNASASIKNGNCFFNNLSINALEIKKTKSFSLLKIITLGNVTAERITKDRSYSDRVWNGSFAEIILFSKVLNDSSIKLVEQYLRYKYAPPVNLGYDIHIPYGFCDTTIDAGERFVNYLWNTGDTTQTISINKSGEYSVKVTDIFGFESYDTIRVYYPEMTQQLTDSTICFYDTIQWNAGLRDTNYTFLWQDNSTDSIINIYSEGNYYVQITDTNSCSYYSDTIHINIDNYPITTTLGDDDTLCSHQNIYLKNGMD